MKRALMALIRAAERLQRRIIWALTGLPPDYLPPPSERQGRDH